MNHTKGINKRTQKGKTIYFSAKRQNEFCYSYVDQYDLHITAITLVSS